MSIAFCAYVLKSGMSASLAPERSMVVNDEHPLNKPQKPSARSGTSLPSLAVCRFSKSSNQLPGYQTPTGSLTITCFTLARSLYQGCFQSVQESPSSSVITTSRERSSIFSYVATTLAFVWPDEPSGVSVA